MICRDSRGVDAVSNARHGSADDKLRGRMGAIERSDLDYNSDNHDQGADHDRTSPSCSITIVELEDGSYQTSNFVDSRDESLPGCIALGLREVIVEIGSGDDATHDTLVI